MTDPVPDLAKNEEQRVKNRKNGNYNKDGGLPGENLVAHGGEGLFESYDIESGPRGEP